MKLLLILFSIGSNPAKNIDYCEKDLTHLSLDDKIDMAIGCSRVGKFRLFDKRKLREIYEQR